MITKNKKSNFVEISSYGEHLTCTFKKRGLFHVVVEENADINRESLAFSQEFRDKHKQITPHLLLFEFNNFSIANAETREMAVNRNSPFVAEAYVVTNLAQRLLIQHYAKKMIKRNVQVKSFNDVKSAKRWLFEQNK